MTPDPRRMTHTELVAAFPVYEPHGFIDYDRNMRAMELAQDEGRLIWLRHVGDRNPFPRFRLFRWLP